MKCQHKKCKTKHKSDTGFCWRHASDIDKHVVQPQRWLRTEPMLYEEALDKATTPRRTI